jgi:maleylacetate reductase
MDDSGYRAAGRTAACRAPGPGIQFRRGLRAASPPGSRRRKRDDDKGWRPSTSTHKWSGSARIYGYPVSQSLTADREDYAMRFLHDILTPRVVFGPGSLGRVVAEVSELRAERILLITGAHHREAQTFLTEALGSRLVGRLLGASEHVPVDVARSAVALAEECGADLLISLGGGSATGLAKAVAKERRIKILAIPTTYAGSEMTPIWGLTDGAVKSVGRDSGVLPATVIYDPKLTGSMPASLVANSGMNALAHCVEAVYAADVSPVIALAAIEGVRSLTQALPRRMENPGDPDARDNALYGAWLAGTALGNATMGLHHKLCHVLGGQQRLSHGGLHSVLLPYVAAFNAGAVPDAMARLAEALAADETPSGIWDLAKRLGAPTSLAELGFDPAGIAEAATAVAANPPSNPRSAQPSDVQELLTAALIGSRPGQRHPIIRRPS